ncbi:MAG: HK97 family phage prohead protease [Clostridium sp.]|nr:HK97 family phage prohead protease [Clostridium sp.]
MRVEIRNDSVLIDGYVNAVGRDSKPIPYLNGKFIEQIEPRAFDKALNKTDNVDLLLNHDESRKLGSTKEGNLELFEDNIGLRAICTITDKDVIEKARKGELRAWSFGFTVDKDRWEDTNKGYQRRYVEDLELFEVSILDNRKNPAYVGTSIEMREDKEVVSEYRSCDMKVILVDKSVKEKVDFLKYENEIEVIKSKKM